jgi:hypothetical protein
METYLSCVEPTRRERKRLIIELVIDVLKPTDPVACERVFHATSYVEPGIGFGLAVGEPVEGIQEAQSRVRKGHTTSAEYQQIIPRVASTSTNSTNPIFLQFFVPQKAGASEIGLAFSQPIETKLALRANHKRGKLVIEPSQAAAGETLATNEATEAPSLHTAA